MPEDRATGRREFLKTCVAGALGAGSAWGAFEPVAARAAEDGGRSRVSIVYDPLLRGDAAQSAGINETRLFQLLDRAMQELYQATEPAHAWARVARRGQRVGIKVNTLGGRGLSSNVQLVEAICERLQEAGIRAQDIVIWDRDTRELERAGFRIRQGGAQVQCYGTDRAGFEDGLASFGSVGSLLSRILTRQVDVLVNVPVLKDHDGAGVSIALKNMYGAIHNPNKYHPDGCNPFVADVNMLQEIRSKLRLHLCDATTACYEGGPAFKPEFTWHANALLASEDPVALDASGWRMIERKRAERGLKSLTAEGREPKYIATAADADHRLGNHDPRRINLIEAHLA